MPYPSLSTRGVRAGQHHAELVHPLHAHRGHQHRGHHRHVQQHRAPPAPRLPPAGEPGLLRPHPGPAVRHEGPAELRPVGPHPLRKGPHRLRDGLPDRAGRGGGHGGHGHELHAAVHHRPLHGAPWLPHARVQARHAGHDPPQPQLQPGHAPGHQRRAVGVRAQPLAGQERAGRRHPAGGEEREVRHGAVGHFAPVHDHHAGHGGVGAAQPPELRQADVTGQGAAAEAAGRHHRRLHQHDALAAHAHQPTALRRVHRVPQQGPRDVLDGARRTRAVYAVHRQPEADLQGQEETHDARAREIWMTDKQT